MSVLSFLVCLVAGTPLIFFPDLVLDLWVGEKLEEGSGELLRWMAIAYVISSAVAFSYYFVNGTGNPKLVSWMGIFQFVSFAFFTFIFLFKNNNGLLTFGYVFVFNHLTLALFCFVILICLLKKAKPMEVSGD